MAAMIQPYALQNFNRTAADLHGQHQRMPFDMDPPYQRGHVWSALQRENLILSFVQGLPVGAVFINRRVLDFSQPERVVDGKQRLTALFDFIDGGLEVPAEWFPPYSVRGGESHLQVAGRAAGKSRVSFPDLAQAGQRRFSHLTVSVYETSLPSEAEEAELYLRINFGGEPQGEQDRARARAVRG